MSSDQPFKADILIVDDTPANLRLLSQMLVGQGYEVRAVTSGARALESVGVSAPDLILLDIKMAEIDGYEVCQRLKEDERSRDIPVIFISALDDIQDKITAFNVGGVDYITKPFQLEEVLARLETHLHLRQLQRYLEDTNKKMAHELEMAAKMQQNFLPHELPKIPGYELIAALKPARETSGDFYDVYELTDGRYGILIADVVDKGVAAALFMVLSWSLIRTYAREHPGHPEQVFEAVNQRLLLDTEARQYVTAFYGVLDPHNGELVYSNAGHLPPLLANQADSSLQKLERTGIPLGIFEGQTWNRAKVSISPGELLVCYTDGVPDAQNMQGEFFSEERLLAAIQNRLSQSPRQIQTGLLEDIASHMDEADQFDDIAIIVMRREAGESA
ncbi:MAG TPA: SpoIIE family protein phosphatase [Anaerolineales bacterium]|nr:SpoIIE family protein phosphatase [Anaerolineales bacterium]